MLNLIKLENRIVLDGAMAGEAVEHAFATHEAMVPGNDASSFMPEHSGDTDHIAGAAALLAADAADAAPDTQPIEIILIADDLPDYQALTEAANPNTHIILYDADGDSPESVIDRVVQLSNELGQPVESLSLLSHGGEGKFTLGSEEITEETLDEHADAWRALDSVFSDGGQIYLFGCNVADDAGQGLLNRLADATGAEVFASNDPTGAGGDWDLEAASENAGEHSDPPLNTDELGDYAGSLAAASKSVTTSEDQDYIFQLGDFGTGITRIKVTQLQTAGDLKLNDAPVTLNQEISAEDIAAGKLVFTPNPDAFGNNYSNFKFRADEGSGYGDLYTTTINAAPVPDNPTGANGSVRTVEDTPYTFNYEDFVFNDVDDIPPANSFAEIKIIQTATKGELTLNGQAVTTNQAISVADIKAGRLTFAPAKDEYDGEYDSFQFKVSDNTGRDSDVTYTMNVSVDAVNDPPASADKTIMLDEDTTYIFKADDFAFVGAPDDGESLKGIQIAQQETKGSLRLNGTEVQLNQEISIDAIKAGSLTFVPDKDANGSDYSNFRFKVSDGQAYSVQPNKISFDVTPVNDPPTSADNAVNTAENSVYTFKIDDFKFEDVDGDSLERIRITQVQNEGELRLNGQTVARDAEISAEDIRSEKLTFTPAKDASGIGYANFRFTVNDGEAWSASPYTMTVNVSDVNSLPTAADNTVVINEDTDYTFKPADFKFSDTDGDSLAKIQITQSQSAGTLKLDGVAVVLGTEIPAADIANGKLTFTPAKDANGEAYSNFRFKVHDGTDYSVDGYKMTIDVNPVNDPPTGDDNSVTLTADKDEYVFRVEDFRFTDVDGDTLAQVEITQGVSAGELKLNGQTVNANTVVTAADIEAGRLIFTPGENAKGDGYASFNFKVYDAQAASAADYTMTVNISEGVIPPTAQSNTVAVEEDKTYTFKIEDFGFNDPDGDDFIKVKITQMETAGKLKLNGTDVDLSTEISADQIRNRDLTFEPNRDANGKGYSNFRFKVADDGGENGEMFSEQSYTMTIDVTPVQDAPTAADNTVTMYENTEYTFTVADFVFNDVDDGDNLVTLKIADVDTGGKLKLDGNPIAPGDTRDIGANQIIAGALTFVPDAGTKEFTFNFQVSDGEDMSVSSYTMTINVSAEPLPIGPAEPPTVYEDQAHTFSMDDFKFEDVNFAEDVLNIKIIKTVTAGSLTLNGQEVTAGTVIAVDDIGNLRFEPNADANKVNANTGTNDPFNFHFRVFNKETGKYSSDTYMMPLDVIPVNDPPISADGEVTLNDDGSYVFKVSDFKFEDDRDRDVTEQGESNQFERIRITELEDPAKGDLEFNGQDVYVGQEIEITDIAAGKLTYKGDNPTTKHFDNFHFMVGDELAQEGISTRQAPLGDGWSDAHIMYLNAGNLPPDVWPQEFWVADGAPAGTVVGPVEATDDKGVVRYEECGGTGEGPFDVDPVTGEIVVAEGAELDAKVTPNYTLCVRVFDKEGLSDEDTMTIHVIATRPTVDLDEDDDGGDGPGGEPGRPPYDFETTFVENCGPVALGDADAVVTNPDGDAIVSMTVTITNMKAGDVLAADTSGTNITVSYNPDNGVLTLEGTDTPDSYTTVLRRVTFENTTENPDEEGRIIEFVAIDGEGETSSVATSWVTVIPLNDAPVNQLPGEQYTPTSTRMVFSEGNGNRISVGDVDADPYDVQVTLDVDYGTISVPGAAVSPEAVVTGDGTNQVVITGTIAEVNAALAGLTYVPLNNWVGEATLTITTNDMEHTGYNKDVYDANGDCIQDGPLETVALTDTDRLTIYVGISGPGGQEPEGPTEGGREPYDGIRRPGLGEGEGLELGFLYNPGEVKPTGELLGRTAIPSRFPCENEELYKCCTLEEVLRIGCRFAPALDPEARICNVTWRWLNEELGWEIPFLDEEYDLYSAIAEKHFVRDPGDEGMNARAGDLAWTFFGGNTDEGWTHPIIQRSENFVQGSDEGFNAAPGDLKYTFFSGRENLDVPATWGSDAWPMLGNVIPCQEDGNIIASSNYAAPEPEENVEWGNLSDAPPPVERDYSHLLKKSPAPEPAVAEESIPISAAPKWTPEPEVREERPIFQTAQEPATEIASKTSDNPPPETGDTVDNHEGLNKLISILKSARK